MDFSDAPLSRREREIMEIIYAAGEAGATQVCEAMADAPSRSSVRTILRILEEKGHLQHRKDGREYIYQPRQQRQDAGASALRRVLQTFFGGSLERAVAAHLADDEDPLSADEAAKLQALIDEARRREDEGR